MLSVNLVASSGTNLLSTFCGGGGDKHVRRSFFGWDGFLLVGNFLGIWVVRRGWCGKHCVKGEGSSYRNLGLLSRMRLHF